MKRLSSCLLGLLVVGSACSAEHAARSEARPALETPVAPAAPAPDRTPLAVRLERELATRPERAVHAERLQALLELRGIHVVRMRQVLASPLGASYCATLVSERGMGASLCEFASAESAAHGMALSEQRFARVLPGRRLMLNDNTLLTLSGAQGDASVEADKVAALFSSLEPESLHTL